MMSNITFRQMDSSDALKIYAEGRLKRLDKFKDKSQEIHVVLSVEGTRHIAEVNYTAKQIQVAAKSETYDMYASIDEVVEKIEKALRRRHDKRIKQRTSAGREKSV